MTGRWPANECICSSGCVLCPYWVYLAMYFVNKVVYLTVSCFCSNWLTWADVGPLFVIWLFCMAIQFVGESGCEPEKQKSYSFLLDKKMPQTVKNNRNCGVFKTCKLCSTNRMTFARRDVTISHFSYKKGGVESGFHHVESNVYNILRLMHIKGMKQITATEVWWGKRPQPSALRQASKPKSSTPQWPPALTLLPFRCPS